MSYKSTLIQAVIAGCASQRNLSPSPSDDSSVFDDNDKDPTFDLSYSYQSEHTESSDSDAPMDVEDTVIENIDDSNKENTMSQNLSPNDETQNVQRTKKLSLSL
ncbi:uncharacterized protein LOC123303009 [Chrysoperla carnea]|uniref:uncharacterized protein LOC123303009 n=1 Tax=Chrysoperla carnea TaxID=189513 RepID=UPI001D091AA7|nr:uncharacterized protein LOC123303009 [Chrysoperla carnea]